MMALPSFIEFLFIGVGFIFLPIGEALAAGELEKRLFEACEEPYSYELAAWVLQEGADPNALSRSGETPLRQLLRQRYATFSRSRYDDNTIMMALLLKNGANLPDNLPPEKNPIRWVADRLDQATWDVLALKFGESEMLRAGAWPLEPVANLAVDGKSIALPPPDGFVPASQKGAEKILVLASKVRLSPEAAVFFVPEDQKDLPPADMTTAAAFISRGDLLGLTNGDEALSDALSLSDDIKGRFFHQYFNNTSYLAASPTTPVPWMPGGKKPPEDSVQLLVSSHGSLRRRQPYQLVYYRFFASEDDITEGMMEHAHGLLAGWHFALRAVNPPWTE